MVGVTRIVYGCVEEDLPSCPGASWGAWFMDLLAQTDLKWGSAGVQYVTSYEACPPWIGFRVDILEFGDTCIFVDGELEDLRRAQATWGRLKELCLARGVNLPAGGLIVSHDDR